MSAAIGVLPLPTAVYHPASDADHRPVELSVVIPCLNEAETLGACIEKATRAMHAHGIDGEVVVADNGSTDGSQDIAQRLGARVVAVPARGYGAALLGGIAAARGRYVIMGDADDSYDFGEVPKFVEKLREGHDVVQGCRLESGGGRVMPGAMPFLHRWWGNPMFSWLVRLWFGAPIHDVHCGMRGFDREYIRTLDLRCTGMEFASEMIIKASIGCARLAEVPITLHRDGRTAHPPHLRTFRDGWRHLRFYLMFSPRWLYLVPGLSLVALGLLCYALGMPRTRIGGVTFDVHTLLFGSLFAICGYQALLFGLLTKVFGWNAGLLRLGPAARRFTDAVTLERGIVGGALGALAGVVLLSIALGQWVSVGFGSLDYGVTMRWVIPGVTLTALGVQTVLSSFFLSILGLARR